MCTTKIWADGTPVAGQQFEYTFDDIGNRTQTKSGGDETGTNLRAASYSGNSLNQYTSRDVPGYVDIFGLSFATNTVTVNGQTAYRKGEYFRKELLVTNGSVALWTNITVAATGQSNVSGNVFVAQTPETFGFDPDGNMTNDGRWVLTWDAENRLVQVESLSSGPVASKRKVAWEYDAKGRRIRQTTSDRSTGSYVVTEDLKLVSDGWRNIAELNATNNALVRSYMWGLDLSGSLDGAGGVGGLLVMKSSANGAHFCTYDGNGNVAALVSASDGTLSANYEYDPFGQTLRATGLMAKENPFRFSTKRSDNTTDFVLYEYRFHNPSTGRWLSRDPIGEDGGVAIYVYSANNPVSQVDPLGESIWSSVLEYTSEGRAQRNPDFPGSIVIAYESGRRSSVEAFTLQWVYNWLPTRGGLCNSGTAYPAHIGTFAQGWVRNGPCHAMVKMKCAVVYVVVFYSQAPGVAMEAALALKVGGRTSSTILGQYLPTHYTFSRDQVLTLSAVETRTADLILMPFERQELYNINPSVSGLRGTRGWFMENLTASCQELDED